MMAVYFASTYLIMRICFVSTYLIMRICFVSTSFQYFREGPLASQAVRALGIDKKDEIPGAESVLILITKTRAFSSNVTVFLQPFFEILRLITLLIYQ